VAINETQLPELMDTTEIVPQTRTAPLDEARPGTDGGIHSVCRPGCQANLVARWVPSLDGMEAKLQAGARVAEICSAGGTAMILLAKAFPRSQFFGFDTDDAAIETARRTARQAGVSQRVYFQFGSPTDFSGWDFDLVAIFDCLHTLPNPEAVARRVRSALAADGAWMIVGPQAMDESKVRAIVAAGGFGHFRRTAETPLHVVFEVRR
jgi:SAM-dependent methyltransferase